MKQSEGCNDSSGNWFVVLKRLLAVEKKNSITKSLDWDFNKEKPILAFL